MTSSERADAICVAANTYGEGMAADYDGDGHSYRVVVTHHGRQIATIDIDSDGDIDWSASRRRSVIRQIADAGR